MVESILVTGGAGFIGSHLVERLLADGKRVFVVDDLSTGTLGNLQAVRGHADLHLIVASTSEIYGKAGDQLHEEHDRVMGPTTLRPDLSDSRG